MIGASDIFYIYRAVIIANRWLINNFTKITGISAKLHVKRSGARGWSDGWSAAEAMPEQVRLTIGDRRTGRLRIPVLVQALQVDTEVDCAGPGRGCPNAEPRGAAQ